MHVCLRNTCIEKEFNNKQADAVIGNRIFILIFNYGLRIDILFNYTNIAYLHY